MGEFDKGKKVGKWKTWFRKYNIYQKIGGGVYDEKGNEIKIGRWVELDDKFDDWKQVTYIGEYKNGKKVGIWDVWFKNQNDGQNIKIGGGSYDEEGNQIKIGKWIELDDKFRNWKQITYIGEYNQGKKVGRWDIWRKDEYNNNIGGGSYDDVANGNKIGRWIELDNNFNKQIKVIYNGEYKNGKKAGRWDIYNHDELIGGGSYDEDGAKNGIWIELDLEFYTKKLITYQGEYNIGRKVGTWEVKIRWIVEKQFTKIGYGSFDEGHNGIKIVKWLDDGFRQRNNIHYHSGQKCYIIR